MALSEPERGLVSAVIPAFNYGHYVAVAVQSVLDQTYSPIECIVVDDGSTDNTADVLATFGGRVRTIRQKNRGLAATRNVGIKASRGEFVALLDADDRWWPDKIARQVDAFAENPTAAAVGCGAEAVGAAGQRLFEVIVASTSPGSDGIRDVFLRKKWVGGSASGAMIRRSVLDRIGLFDETLTAAEDWDMWLRIVAEHPIVNLPDVLVTILKHQTGTFTNAAKMEANQRKVFDRAVARWPDVIDGATRRRGRALIAADAGREHALAGSHFEAVSSFARSLYLNPRQLRLWLAALNSVARLAGLTRRSPPG